MVATADSIVKTKTVAGNKVATMRLRKKNTIFFFKIKKITLLQCQVKLKFVVLIKCFFISCVAIGIQTTHGEKTKSPHKHVSGSVEISSGKPLQQQCKH